MKVVFKKIKDDLIKEKNDIIKDVLHKYYKIDNYKLKVTKNNNVYIEGKTVYISVSNTDNYLFMVFDKKPVGCDIELISSNLNKSEIKEVAIKKSIIRLEDLESDDDIDINKYNLKTKMVGKNIISIVTYKD